MNPILHYRNDDGTVVRIGPEHPDYEQLLAQYLANQPDDGQPPAVKPRELVKIGAISVAGSVGLFWWQYSRIVYAGKFSPLVEFLAASLTIAGVLCLILAFSPKWSGNRPGATGPGKLLLAVICLAVLGGGALGAYLFHSWATGRLGS